MQTHHSHHAAATEHGLIEQVTHARASAAELVREHPFASLGVFFGSGLLLGAVAHKLLEHKVTFGELLADRTGRGLHRVQRWAAAVMS